MEKKSNESIVLSFGIAEYLMYFLHLFHSCVALCDLTGDGDTKLVVADLGTGNYNMKLRVYKGTQLVNDTKKFALCPN